MSPVSESGQRMSSDHEPLEMEERKEPLSKLQVFLLNLTWFGLYVMFLDLSVVGMYLSICTWVMCSQSDNLLLREILNVRTFSKQQHLVDIMFWRSVFD